MNITTGSRQHLPIDDDDFNMWMTQSARTDEILVLAGGDQVVAFSPDGRDAPLWTAGVSAVAEYPIHLSVIGDTVIAGGAGFGDPEAEANEHAVFDLHSGQQLWARTGEVLGIDGERVVNTEDYNKRATAFAPHDNQDLWTYRTDGWVERTGSWLLDCDWDKNCSALASQK